MSAPTCGRCPLFICRRPFKTAPDRFRTCGTRAWRLPIEPQNCTPRGVNFRAVFFPESKQLRPCMQLPVPGANYRSEFPCSRVVQTLATGRTRRARPCARGVRKTKPPGGKPPPLPHCLAVRLYGNPLPPPSRQPRNRPANQRRPRESQPQCRDAIWAPLPTV
jgi:hypothetical protein